MRDYSGVAMKRMRKILELRTDPNPYKPLTGYVE
jgi:hypothetical protein